MDKGELEVRLLVDEQFRARVLGVVEAQKKMHQAEHAQRLATGYFHAKIKELVTEVGIPVASVARWTDLSHQAVSVIVHDEETR